MGGCAGCGVKTAVGLPAGCRNNGSCSTGGCGDKLDVHDWLANIYYYEEVPRHPIVEVKFKGTRKEFFRNANGLDLEIGDAVVVESATTGWDLGYVSVAGELVHYQLKKYKLSENSDFRRLLRKATEYDFAKYDEGKNLEYETMLQARRLAVNLGLSMKLSDVEYQGDRTKATFFYTAEGRVDFRELIKVLAREFRIKVEMRQIGLRQEAGRLGGIGSCGRELCCSTWLTDFHSVPTMAARYQNLFLNPLKLSGQCGRLKCCLNYELDVYVEAIADFPEENTRLRTEKGIARVEKMDILKRLMWFRYEDAPDPQFYPLDIEEVKKIIAMNEDGITPPDLDAFQAEEELEVVEIGYKDTVGEERLDRFDRKGRNKKRRDKNKGPREGQRPQGGGPQSTRFEGQRQSPGDRPQGGGQQRQRPQGDRLQGGGRDQGDRQPQSGGRDRDQRPQGQGGQQRDSRQGRDQRPQGNRPQNSGRDNRPREQRPQGGAQGDGQPRGNNPEQRGPNQNQDRNRNRNRNRNRGPGREGGGNTNNNRPE